MARELLQGTLQTQAHLKRLIATLWEETIRAITRAGDENFAVKVVIDVTNPLEFSKGMPPTLAITLIQIPAAKLCIAYCATPAG